MKQRKRMISVIAVIMAVLMLLSLVASVIPSAFAISQSDIDALQAKKDEISARVKEAEARVDTLKEAQANVLDQKTALEEKNDAAKEALRLVGEEIVMYDGIIEEKTEELNEALGREKEQLEKYRTRVRAMEESGTLSYVDVLFSATSLTDLLSKVSDITHIMSYDKNLQSEYATARENVEELKNASPGSDDFAFYLERFPGAMFRIGTGNEDPATHIGLHNGKNRFDERCIPAGAAVLIQFVLDSLL